MECLSVSKLPEDSQWVWEIKLDGYRAIAVKSRSDVRLFSRQKKSLNRQFPYILKGLADLPAGAPISICCRIAFAPLFGKVGRYSDASARGCESEIGQILSGLLVRHGLATFEFRHSPILNRRTSCSVRANVVTLSALMPT